MTFLLLLSIPFLIVGLVMIWSALSFYKGGELYFFHIRGDEKVAASLGIFFGVVSIGSSLFFLLLESIYYFVPYISLYDIRGFTAICIVALPSVMVLLGIIIFFYSYWKKEEPPKKKESN